MDPIELNKKSWHYILVSRMTSLQLIDKWDGTDLPIDICQYLRYLVGAILVTLLLTVAGSAVLFGVGSLVYCIGAGLITGVWAFTPAAKMAVILIGGIALVLFACWILYMFQKFRERRREDGFIKHAYRSWKEKYCTMVVFKD